ncbi:MAG: hypothetical protein RLZZ200_1314 [Pseudomonadota bacterium]
MDARNLLQEWLDLLGWTDAIRLDEHDPALAIVETPYRIGPFVWQLLVRASSSTELASVRLYPPVVAKEDARSEVCLLLNALNARNVMGAFVLLSGDRIQFRIMTDFEGAAPAGRSIALMSGSALDACLEFHEVLFAVALGQLSAAEALAAHDSRQKPLPEAISTESRAVH